MAEPLNKAEQTIPIPKGKSAYHSDDLDSYSKKELMLAFRNHGIHYEGLQEETTPVGMHYLLVHFDIPKVDINAHKLRIQCSDGSYKVFTMQDIMARPKVSMHVTMECAGNGRTIMKPRMNVSQPWDFNAVGNSEWGGTSLAALLEECGHSVEGDKQPVEALFTGKDKGIQHGSVQLYQRSLPFKDTMNKDTLLAYEMNGQKLLPQHGYPLRLIIPGFYGMTSVKWLECIEFLDSPFNGVQMQSYIIKQSKEDKGIPVSRIVVRSLFIPPGIPDWFNRHRFVEEGDTVLEGRAWAGGKQIVKVEVGIDGEYSLAQIEPSLGKYSWNKWTFNWKATHGKHILSVRATDDEGNTQPDEAVWNFGGFANNIIQKLKVIVKTKEELELGAPIDLAAETREIDEFEIVKRPEHQFIELAEK